MSKLVDSALRAIGDNNMLSDGDSVVVGLSGGADSVSLLYTLISIKEKFNLKIYAAHLNHMLRGAEADRDESFARSVCEKEGIELFVKRVDIRALSEKMRLGTELCGRNARYEFFSELSERLGAKIATAHTASDNAETVLFNLIRGAGLKGLSGIAPVRDNIVRPLIYATREDIEDFCRENALEYVTDSTNLTDDYTRNKIRHLIIPVCREINPDFENAAARSGLLLRNHNSYLEQKTDEAIRLARTPDGYRAKLLANLHPAVLGSVLYRLCGEKGIEPDFTHISLLSGCVKGSGAVDLDGEYRAVCSQGIFRFTEKFSTAAEFSDRELKLGDRFTYNDNIYSVKEVNGEKNLLDMSVLERKPVFRRRKAGDFIRLPKRKVSKTVKKLFTELKIPSERRSSVLLLADGSEVLWIEGIYAGSETGRGIKIEVMKG